MHNIHKEREMKSYTYWQEEREKLGLVLKMGLQDTFDTLYESFTQRPLIREYYAEIFECGPDRRDRIFEL